MLLYIQVIFQQYMSLNKFQIFRTCLHCNMVECNYFYIRAFVYGIYSHLHSLNFIIYLYFVTTNTLFVAFKQYSYKILITVYTLRLSLGIIRVEVCVFTYCIIVSIWHSGHVVNQLKSNSHAIKQSANDIMICPAPLY